MLTTLPFAGFYNSLHDARLDDELRQLFSDYDTGCEVNEPLLDAAYDVVDWRTVHTRYCREYVEAFAKEFGLKSLRFESLQSPREYNFETDRIFCHVDEAEVRRLIAQVGIEAVTEKARERFTSCDGFISFYSPDIGDWGPLEAWDHNQVGTVLEALVGDGFDVWAEDHLLEHLSCNGHIQNWMCESKEVTRLVNIHDYLQQRNQRVA